MGALGIDFRLLIVQTVNFLILFYVLKKWVYPPFIKFLEDRARKIQESLEAAEKMRHELKSFEAEKGISRKKTALESQEILENSRREGEAQKEKIINEAKKQGEQILEEVRIQLASEKERNLKEAEQKSVELALNITAKIVADLDETQARLLIKRALDKAEELTYENRQRV